MCGIHGITKFYPVTDETTSKVKKMLDKAKHRGPDQNDIVTLPHAVLAMNRLAIVAPDEKSTVLCDENEQVFVTFNGEIVNYLELYDELDIPPKEKCDNAVIIPLWKKYGPSFVKKLAGMFAIALYDVQKETLYLWRDPLGVKPLYYCLAEDSIFFSSEIKSIYSSLDKKPDISFGVVDHMLRHRFHPGRETIFPIIQRVFPGEQIVFKKGKEEHSYFWFPKKNVENTKPEASIEKFRELFKEVIKQNTRGDVPGGYFVSGGLDSSFVTSVGLEHPSKYRQPISIKFSPTSVVDEEYAQRLEAYLGVKFAWVNISDEDARQAQSELVAYMDEPLENPIHVGTYLMSKKANELGIKSVLTGDGSDETFIGYARQACWFLEDQPEQSYLKLLWTLTPSEADELYLEQSKLSVYPMKDEQGKNIEPFQNIDNVLRFERKERLSEYHCMRLDRMTMAFGVEAKVPFLDHRIVEFAQNISIYDLFGKSGKEWLQEASKPWVPEEIIDRQKIHFPSLPDQWLSGEGVDWMKNILLSENVHIYKWLRKEIVEKYINEHEQQVKQHGRVLWALITLELWLNEVEKW